MKHGYTFLLLATIAASQPLQAQPQYGVGILDLNNVSARFHTNGLIGMDLNGGQGPGYFVPKTPDNSGPSPLFAGGLWIGGLSPDYVLHFAGERFEQIGLDFFPGPLGTNGAISQATSTQYDRFWRVYRFEVQQQIAYFNCLNDPTCDTQAEFPGYSVPISFYSWPAHGDADLGQAYNLADFYDYNGDGTYNPDDGDAPCMPGDMALLSIYNDKLNTHTESGGLPIGVEVHMTAFAYSSNDPALNNTVFIRYKIINRSSMTLSNTYIGLFSDYDLGCANDDYVQCDVGRNLFFVLNGDINDVGCNGHPGYGVQPPAFGEVILQGPKMDVDGIDNADTTTAMGFNGTGFNDGIVDNERLGMGRFIGFLNDSVGVTSDPNTAAEYYNYLKGQWMDNTPLTYGGNGYSTASSAVPARFAFPGDSDPLGVGTNGQVLPPWTETIAGLPPADQRGVASMGPFTFEPGEEQDIVVAYVYARAGGGGAEYSAEVLKLTTDTIRAFAQTIPGLLGEGSPCNGLITGITTKGSKDLGLLLYPNPANDRLHVVLPNPANHATIVVFDAQGALVLTQEVNSEEKLIDVTKLSSGLYMARVQSGGKNYSRAFVKQ